jgi:hypothetical protein
LTAETSRANTCRRIGNTVAAIPVAPQQSYCRYLGNVDNFRVHTDLRKSSLGYDLPLFCAPIVHLNLS